MCHLLPLIAFTHAFVPCYGKITTKDVCRSMREALFWWQSKKVENRNIVSSSLTIKHFWEKMTRTRSMRLLGSFNMSNRSLV